MSHLIFRDVLDRLEQDALALEPAVQFLSREQLGVITDQMVQEQRMDLLTAIGVSGGAAARKVLSSFIETQALSTEIITPLIDAICQRYRDKVEADLNGLKEENNARHLPLP